MIAAWEVVAVLVPLCSASAATGYAYAKRLGEIERGPDEPAVPMVGGEAAVPVGAGAAAPPIVIGPSVAPPDRTPAATTRGAQRADRRVTMAAAPPDHGSIDLGERLRPFAPGAAPPASAAETRPPDPAMSQSPQSTLRERMVAPIDAQERASGS